MENQNNTTFNSDFCEYPVIKAVNGEDTFPPTNSLETNIGDMIIGTNDFTIETYIKFDDVNQDHRIINHVETSRNRSAWLLYHRGDRTESSGGSFGDTKGRWFQWLVNNGHGSGSEHNNWVNHISFLSPISLENDTWYHIALVRKDITNWAFYVNGQKHEAINGGNMFRQSYSFGSYSGNIPSFSGPTYIGYNYYSTSGDYYMQSFRVTNVAMYSHEFFPHKAPHIENDPCIQPETLCPKIDPNDPVCDEVALSIQSDTNVTRSVTRSVTLQWYMLLPNHSIANHANGTLSHSQTFDITEDVTKVDQWFMYSNTKVIGRNTGNWTASAEPGGVNPNKANLTYNDTGEKIVVDLTNRKLTLANGGAGHNLTFNFDVPYGKESPSIEDNSLNAHAITKHGDVTHSSAESILGDSALHFDGNGDYLSLPASNDWKFANTDFTLEAWVNFDGTQPSSLAQGIESTHGGSANLIQTAPNGGLSDNAGWGINLYFDNVAFYWEDNNTSTNYQGLSLITTTTFVPNVWVHIAVVKHNNTITGYVNGQKTDSKTITGWKDSNLPLEIGRRARSTVSNLQYYFRGYLQDLRISKKAVYTGCFVPPSKLHPNLLNTPLNPNCAEVLLHVQSDTTNVSDAVVDSSRNQYEFTKRGNATHSTDQKIHGASSLYFDGDGDALSINNADTLNGDFTFETWINLKNIPAESEFTLPSEVASSAIDGELLEITEDTTLQYTDDRISALTTNTITLTSKSGSDFKTNQRLLIISTYGANADTIGNYEFVEIASINGNVLTLKSNIQKTYDVANYTFVVAPKRYNKIIVNEDVNVSSVAWSASSDSIQGLVLLSANEIQVKGQISANELGFRGGTVGTTSNKNGGIGESYVAGKWNTRSTNGQYGSGGAGVYYNHSSGGDIGTSGAGAGHGTSGTGGNSWYSSGSAKGGTAFALDTIKEKIFMGPGGGQGGSDNASPSDTRSARGGYGGRGAGIVIIDAIYCEVSETGIISANGQRGLEAYDPGNGEAGNGGGGAGGSILFTGNIDNEGIIQTTRGDRRVADGSGQSGGYGYTSGYGGHGVIAWFGYNVGNNQINCLAHSPWKNTSYILDTHSTDTTNFGGNKLGLIAIPSKESGKYDVAYGNFGGKLIRSKLNLTYNEWNHVALVRKNDIETFYINGSRVSTRTHSLDYPNEIIALGSQSFNNFEYPLELNGYLQDVRISTKAVVEGCFVPPVSLVDNLDIVLPNQPECDEINLWLRSDTNIESSAITDTSKNKHSIAKHGNARHETSKKLFGESALYFDGNGDYLQIEDNSLRNLHNGANDFTIECWVNISAWQRDSSGQQRAHILGTGGTTAEVGIWLVAINYNNNGFVFRVTKGSVGSPVVYMPSRTQVNLNTWYHVAVSYNSDTYKLFVDGLLVNESSGNHSHSSANSYHAFRVGRMSWPSNTAYFKGYLQDLRISSKAVYTGCFKLPTTFQSEECIPTPTPTPTPIGQQDPTPTPTPTCTPKISWQVNDANGNWIDRNYDASLYLDETEPGKYCTSDWKAAHLCADATFSNNWNLTTSSHFRNLVYTDCDGNVISGTSIEFRKITALCGTEPNSRHLEFKACFDTTTPTPTPTSTCTPKISWQVHDGYGNWINRNYDASLYVEETEPGRFCTKNSDGFVEASLCIGPKTHPNVTSTWGLTSNDIRNFTYTDCYGNVTTATDVELTRRTGTCASETNSWRVWFKACFDTTTPTPTQTPVGQQDPTPTPTPTAESLSLDCNLYDGMFAHSSASFIPTNGTIAIGGMSNDAQGILWRDMLNTPHETRQGYLQDLQIGTEIVRSKGTWTYDSNGRYGGLTKYLMNYTSFPNGLQRQYHYLGSAYGKSHSNNSTIKLVNCIATPTPTPIGQQESTPTPTETPITTNSELVYFQSGRQSIILCEGGKLLGAGDNSRKILAQGQGQSTETRENSIYNTHVTIATNVEKALVNNGQQMWYITKNNELYMTGYFSGLFDTTLNSSSEYSELPVKISNNVVDMWYANINLYVKKTDNKLYMLDTWNNQNDPQTAQTTPLVLVSDKNPVEVFKSPSTQGYSVSNPIFVRFDDASMWEFWRVETSNGRYYTDTNSNKIADNVIQATSDGYYHSFYVTSDNKLYGHSSLPNKGQLGNGTTTANSSFDLLASDAVKVMNTRNNTWYLTTGGKVKGTGEQTHGNVGDGVYSPYYKFSSNAWTQEVYMDSDRTDQTPFRSTFTTLNMNNVVDIANGMARLANGNVLTWGGANSVKRSTKFIDLPVSTFVAYPVYFKTNIQQMLTGDLSKHKWSFSSYSTMLFNGSDMIVEGASDSGELGVGVSDGNANTVRDWTTINDICVVPTPTPTETPIAQPTPTPTETPTSNGGGANPDGDGGAELEFRWAEGIYSDEKILQIKNLKQPTHADGNFEDRDMSAWSTVYAREDNEDQFDLSHAFWPDAAVDESYSFSKNITFDGITIELDNSDTLPTGQTTNNGYLQLYANFENAKADLDPAMTNTSYKKALFVYFGDNADSENTASGRVGASLIKYLPSTTTTGEATAGTNLIPIDPAIQSSFKIGQTIILSQGTAIQETHEIDGFGSLKTVDPLANTHPDGSTIDTPSDSSHSPDPTPTSSDFCDCSSCDSHTSGTTVGSGQTVQGSDGNYYQCDDPNGCTDDPTDSNSDQYTSVDPASGCDCCETPTPYDNPCAGLGNQDCPNANNGYVTSVAPFASPDANGNCYPSCNQCLGGFLDNNGTPVQCERANGHKRKSRIYRDINNNCDWEDCECDKKTTNCNNVANGGNANYKSQNIKRDNRGANGCTWDFSVCECNDDEPPQALINAAIANCQGKPVRDINNNCNWTTPDIGCNETIAGGGQTKKECKEANLQNCNPAANHKNDKETLDANCDVVPCECLDAQFEGVGVKTCADGRELSRDVNNNCEFPDCEPCDTTVTDKADCPGNQQKQMQQNCEWSDCKCVNPPAQPDCGANKQAVWDDTDCEWNCECLDHQPADLQCTSPEIIIKNDDDCTQECGCDETQPADDCANDNHAQIQNDDCTWECRCFGTDPGNFPTDGWVTNRLKKYTNGVNNDEGTQTFNQETCEWEDDPTPTPTPTSSPTHTTTDYVTIPQNP